MQQLFDRVPTPSKTIELFWWFILLFRRLIRTVQPVTWERMCLKGLGAQGPGLFGKGAEASLVTHATTEGDASRQITYVALSSLFMCVIRTVVSGGCWRAHVTRLSACKGYIKAQRHQYDLACAKSSPALIPYPLPGFFLRFVHLLCLFFVQKSISRSMLSTKV